MAIRIVSNTGGNFFTAGAWVGGIIPSNNDTIAFTSTSGPLLVDGAYQIFGIDFTNYTNTITFVSNTNGSLVFDDTLGVPFINMGTGGFTIIDNSNDGGFDFSLVSGAISLTNTTGMANTARFKWFFATDLIQVTGTWLQTGPINTYDIRISSGTFIYTGTVYDGLSYYFYAEASLGATFNLNTTDPTIELALVGLGTFNINAIDITSLNIANSSINNITCGDINSIYMAGTVNLYGAGSILEAAMTNQAVGTGTSTITLNLSAKSILNFYYNDTPSVTVENIDLNIVSTINCTNLYIRKPTLMTTKFLGTHGFNCDNLIIDGLPSIESLSIIFKSGVNYNINSSINITHPIIISSDTPGSRANIILGPNINQNTISELTATDIDSSGGRRVNNFYGTITNCVNWKVWNDNTLPQISSTF